MSKHTPGPWDIELIDGGAFNVQKDGAGFAGGTLVLASRREHPLMEGEMHANARLISAAPELLSAAQKARAALSELLMTRDPIVYSDALRELDEAIAKATGEA